ncbi:LADA_0H18404g1_1 [Lachancea dasiensis]|uniref:LADA_0H18404g1_1 n=1 Tax=Lachancea dasiensis TaxID=1072105 RepID=A0A1G4K5X4_9SACH|nr:LADA_0H18404g1_1 [Lachancea dasiensis]
MHGCDAAAREPRRPGPMLSPRPTQCYQRARECSHRATHASPNPSLSRLSAKRRQHTHTHTHTRDQTPWRPIFGPFRAGRQPVSQPVLATGQTRTQPRKKTRARARPVHSDAHTCAQGCWTFISGGDLRGWLVSDLARAQSCDGGGVRLCHRAGASPAVLESTVEPSVTPGPRATRLAVEKGRCAS